MDNEKKRRPLRGNELIRALCEQYGMDPVPVKQITITAHADSLVWVDIELFGDERIAEIVLREDRPDDE